jgi:hypothetical protein
MTNQRYAFDVELHEELKGMIEDTVAHFCDEHMISGELAWLVTECVAISKIAQLKGEIT